MRGHNLSNKVFGKWTVLEMTNERVGGKIHWLCRCECGLERVIAGTLLSSGKTTQCLYCSRVKHGHANKQIGKSETYSSWSSMHQRCRNPKSTGYHRYGGRGIDYCKRWEQFTNFLEDMGERPNGTTLERIDNEKGYDPSNCKWATPLEQGQNMARNLHVHCDGEKMSLNRAASIVGKAWTGLKYHLERYGLTIIGKHVLVPSWIPELRRRDVTGE